MLKTLDKRCWHVRWPDGSDTNLAGDPQPHFDTEQEGRDWLTKDDEPGETHRGFGIEQYPLPCVEVICECGEAMTDDDTGFIVHNKSEAEVREMVRHYGFVITDDGRVLCDPCSRDRSRPLLILAGVLAPATPTNLTTPATTNPGRTPRDHDRHRSNATGAPPRRMRPRSTRRRADVPRQ